MPYVFFVMVAEQCGGGAGCDQALAAGVYAEKLQAGLGAIGEFV